MEDEPEVVEWKNVEPVVNGLVDALFRSIEINNDLVDANTRLMEDLIDVAEQVDKLMERLTRSRERHRQRLRTHYGDGGGTKH